ncbi:flavin reductase family protein [Natronospora cellulosivora (SeqCode)]
MREVRYNQYAEEAIQGLSQGAFLTVKDGDKVNTMTIGWGNIGFIWGKPVFMVMVRGSRYTYEFMEKNDEFTVSIPFSNNMKDELKFCGTKSGRDYDKFQECNLKAIPGKKVAVPLVAGCDLHYECKIKFKQEMDPKDLDIDYNEKWYTEGNYHTLYFGEILASFYDDEI